MTRFLIIIFVLNAFIAFGQSADCKECPSLSAIIEKDSIRSANPAMALSKGVVLENGKISMSEEASRLLSDSVYRKSVYPTQYTFDSIPSILNRKEYYLALWHLVNAYPNNKNLAYSIAVELTKIGVKGDYYVSAFYTYALFDPETMVIENGKPVLVNPDKIEAKMKLFQQFSMLP